MALKLYLSGAGSAGGSNSDVSKSLGQYPSTVGVENDLLGNLFGTLSKYTIQKGRAECAAIVLSNEDTFTYTNLKTWIRYSDDSDSEDGVVDDCEFELGYASLILDSCGDPVFKYSITNPNSSPMGVTFVSADSDVNFLSLPDMAAGTMLGLWIRRKISTAAQLPRSTEDLVAILDGTLILPTTEQVELKFDYTP